MVFNWSVDTSGKKFYLLLIASFITVLVSYLQYRLPLKSFDGSPEMYTHYNNYVIFKLSHFHLLDNKDIYTFYNDEVHDLFKYSPAFALLFGFFSRLPDVIGLSLWNVLNVFFLLFVLLKFKNIWTTKSALLLVFITPELILTTQHAQCNALMTGLILLSYLDFEDNKSWRAAIWITIAGFIKIYAGVAAILFLFYDKKINFVITGIITTIVLAIIPLTVISPSALWIQYQSWWQLLTADHNASEGLSLIQVIQLFFPWLGGKVYIQWAGIFLLLTAAIVVSKNNFKSLRQDFLSLLLLSLILFNHKSESATYIIAVTGMAIWYFSKALPLKIETTFILFAFIFTVLSSSDIFPPFIRNNYFIPYGVKVWSCILIYLYLCSMIFKKLISHT